MNIHETQRRLRRFRDDRDWRQFHTPQNLAQALSVEAGELLECFLWGDEWRRHDRERVAEECADVMIYLLQIADACGIDLAHAVDAKIICNAQKYPVQSRLPYAG